MYYGLTYNDIIQAFNGVIESDFETNSVSGAEIIIEEIEMAFEDSLKLLHPAALEILATGYIPPHIIENLCPDEEGVYSFDLIGNAICADIRIVRPQVNSELPWCDEPCKPKIENFPVFDDYEIIDGRVILGDTYEGETLIISYHIDPFSLEFGGMKRYLRNKVACTLGHQLFSAGDDTWKLVDHYCSDARHFEEAWIKKGYRPRELNLKWLENIYGYGIYSVRVRRV